MHQNLLYLKSKLSILLIAFMSFYSFTLSAQIHGNVTDIDGLPVPYASVYVEGTSIGTITNKSGDYSFETTVGPKNIVFQYIGYKSVVKPIVYEGEIQLDAVLHVESFDLEEVVISADGEDPALAIIKKAIIKRPIYRNAIKEYEVDLYAKGMVKMRNAPSKIFGQDVGNMGGMLDSTKQGILYLSESQSKVYFKAPNKIKEIMYSSKVAESDNAFNSNMLANAYFNIYEEHYDFGTIILNPIADNAPLFYNYKLEGAIVNELGQLVNKISVEPKNAARPLMFGYLYIVNDNWNVSEVNLSFTGKSVKSQIMDTVNIKQIYFDIEQEKYAVLHQHMSFKADALGFSFGGDFTHVFSDYKISIPLDDQIFGAETFVVTNDAIKNDLKFWNEARPVPLTNEEFLEYKRKDSLKIIWKSKEFLDSLDQINNKFGLANLAFGYNYQNSHEHWNISLRSPLTTYQFNAIEGHKLNLNLAYDNQDSIGRSKYNVKLGLGYGFSDKKFKTDLLIKFYGDRKSEEFWQLDFGDKYKQYDIRLPISTLAATYSGLIQKNNMMLMFWSRYGELKYHKEIVNGIRISPSVKMARRFPSHINSDYSFFNRSKTFASNDPLNSNNFEDFFPVHNINEIGVDVSFSPFQKYMSLPNMRIRQKSKWPDFEVSYKKALSLNENNTNARFDKLRFMISDDIVKTKFLGFSSYRLSAGTFLTKNNPYFIDYQHFYGMSTVRSSYKGAGFKIMPRYKYSTIENYLTINYEHNFNGFLLDAIPLVNKLRLKTIMSVNALLINGEDNYYEASIGLGNVGIKMLRMFRVDYAISFKDDGSIFDKRIVLGFTGEIN